MVEALGKKCSPVMLYWRNLALGYHLLGDYNKELTAARGTRKRFPLGVGPIALEARALSALGDTDAVARLVTESFSLSQKPVSSVQIPVGIADEVEWHGHTQSASSLVRTGLAANTLRSHSGNVSPLEAYPVGRLYLRQADYAAAERIFRSLLTRDSSDVDVIGNLGIVAAITGRKAEALRLSEKLRLHPALYLDGRHTFWRAAIAARLGDKPLAVQLLRESLQQGRYHNSLHGVWELEPLRGYSPFEDLIATRG